VQGCNRVKYNWVASQDANKDFRKKASLIPFTDERGFSVF
jgi:hypothetical protein